MNTTERRDLAALAPIVSASGAAATVRLGLPLLPDGVSMRVVFDYNGQRGEVVLPYDAGADAVATAVAAQLAVMDEAADLAALVGEEVSA